MAKNSKSDNFALLLILLGLLPLGYWTLLQLGQDLWWDELISLKNYALADLTTNVTVNPDMNNHIFFNLLNNLYSRLIGQRDFYELIGRPYYLRFFQLIISSGTIYYSYRVYKDFVEKESAFIVPALLISCLPFLNFSLQLRGYALSMLLLTAIVFHTYSYIKFKKRHHLPIITLAIFCALFTLASNIYVVASFYLIFTINLVLQHKQKNRCSTGDAFIKTLKARAHIFLFIAVGTSLLLTLLAYLPTLDELLNNRFVENAPPDRFFVLNTRLIEVISYMFSYRWLLFLAPIMLIYTQNKNGQKANFSWFSLAILVSFLLPFVLSFLHNKAPYQRTFVVLAPFFNIFIAIIIGKSISLLSIRHTMRSLLYVSLVVYLSIWALMQIMSNDKNLVNKLQPAEKEQNIYRNYYQASNFIPDRISQHVASINTLKHAAILLDEIDRVSLVFYLERYNIPSTSLVRIDKKQSTQGDKTFNRLAIIQQSNADGGDVEFFSFPFNENDSQTTNPYDFMMGVNSDLRNGEVVHLLTANPDFSKESMFVRQFYNCELKDRTGFTHIYEISRKQ